MNDNKIKIDLSDMDETNGQPKKNKQARDWRSEERRVGKEC